MRNAAALGLVHPLLPSCLAGSGQWHHNYLSGLRIGWTQGSGFGCSSPSSRTAWDWFRFVRFAQQQPVAGLDHWAGRPVLVQSVGLVHAYLVDHFTTALGSDMKQVVTDLGIGTMGPDSNAQAVVMSIATARICSAPPAGSGLKEASGDPARAPTAHPQHLATERINDDHSISAR